MGLNILEYTLSIEELVENIAILPIGELDIRVFLQMPIFDFQ